MLAFLFPVLAGAVAVMLEISGRRWIAISLFGLSYVPTAYFLYAAIKFRCPKCSAEWPGGLESECPSCGLPYGSS